MTAGYGASLMAGQQLGPALSLASGVLCVGGIAGLSSQNTARMGNVMGMSGVALGITSVLGTMPMDAGTAGQVALMMGGGGLAGHQIASKVKGGCGRMGRACGDDLCSYSLGYILFSSSFSWLISLSFCIIFTILWRQEFVQ